MEFDDYVCKHCVHFKECYPNGDFSECYNPECYWVGKLFPRHGDEYEKDFPDFESQEEDLEVEIGVGEF